jgi:hypothetical protein
MGNNAGSDVKAAYLFIAPAIIGFTVFVVYPLIRSFHLSLTRYNGLSDPVFVGLGNFRRLFTVDPAFWPSLRATAYDTEQQYTTQGLLVDWTDKITNGDGDFKADKFVPSAMENRKTADGQMGGLPSLMNVSGVWYNADAFKAAGLPEPKAGWSWDEMYAAAAKLTGKKPISELQAYVGKVNDLITQGG